MTTLVTGATGLLGNNVVRLLCDQGSPVRVLMRENADDRTLAGLDVDRVPGDVRNAPQLQAAFQNVKTVIHCAGVVHIGWSQRELHQAVNVEGTKNVAEAAQQANARMVHVSSVDALGMGTMDAPADEDTPAGGGVDCPYVVSKREAEQSLLNRVKKGLDAVIVNPAYMLGPFDWKPSSGRMLLEVANRFTPMAPPGGNNFCDVRDVASGIKAAAEKGKAGRRYILGGDALSYFDAWNMFARVTGTRGPKFRLTRLAQLIGGTWGDFSSLFTNRESDLNSAAIRIACLPHYFSSERAKRELGYMPRPAEEAARAAWDWFCQNGYVSKRKEQKQRA